MFNNSSQRPKSRLHRSALALALGILGSGAVHAFESVPGEYIVRFKDRNTAKIQLSQKSDDLKLASLGDGVSFRVRVSPTAQKSLGLSSLKSHFGSNVKYVEPNFIYHAFRGSPPPPTTPTDGRRDRSAIPAIYPNDPKFSELWGLSNTKQVDGDRQRGDGRADIWAPQAWKVFTGSRNVVVAVIDTGVDYNHPDLRANMWSDANGKHGYNAITDSLDPMDDNEHGTHCAGTIGGVGSNGVGVTGINWNVRIMGVKFLSASGSGATADAIKAIRWAVDHGAKILSNSWGGGGYSQALEDAIKYAESKGVLVIAAAGNESNNNDSRATYPAGYKVANVVSVAATDNLDVIASFSNYGKTTVHLAAPGVGILSTVPGGGYDVFSGTSMATPHVAGAAALLLGYKPGLSAAQIKAQLMKTVEVTENLKGSSISGGRLNIYDLLTQ